MRLASYNVRKAVGLDRRREPSRILDVVASLGADIVALQEADKRLGSRPSPFNRDEIKDRTGLEPLSLGVNGVSLGWHGNALLVRHDIKVQKVTLLDLPGLEPRGAIMVHVQFGQISLSIVAVHLGLTKSSRSRQCQAIQNTLRQNGTRYSVVMGDFNEWRKIGGLSALAQHHNILSPGRSFHASRPIAALDRFALSSGIEILGAGVKEDSLSKKASDHLPIWADIRVGQDV